MEVANPTIREALAEFLEQQKERLSPATFRRYQDVIELLQHSLDGYAHQSETMMTGRLPPVHLGEVLLEEFLAPMGISRYRLRLARYFGTSERFWLNLQSQYDLDVERDRIGKRIEEEITPRAV